MQLCTKKKEYLKNICNNFTNFKQFLINVDIKNSDLFNSLNQLKKSPRELAIIFQTKLNKLKAKYIK